MLRDARSVESLMLERLIRNDEVLISPLVITEVLRGFRRKRDAAAFEERLLEFPTLDPSVPGDYLLAAALYREARRSGFAIRSTIDCLIAASCVRTGTPLLHRDADFDLLASFSPLEARRA